MRFSTIRSITAASALGLALIGCASTSSSGGTAPDFVAVTTAGDEITGESLLGKVTIVDFWAVF